MWWQKSVSATLAFLALGTVLGGSETGSMSGKRDLAGVHAQILGPRDPTVYAKDKLEHFMSGKVLDYVRPGLNILVEKVEITADRKPVATLRLSDDRNQPLDRLGNLTPGTISISLVLAVYDGSTRSYTAYTMRSVRSTITGNTATQAAADSGGVWQDPEPGRAIYTFGTTLPPGFDGSRTHTLAIYATRNLTEIAGKNYFANALFDFRPDGGPVEEVWQGMTTATCNTCHDPLAEHGGSRQEVKLCVTCHSPQSSDPDTGNTVDMKVMVHKIHYGENLPSVTAGTPYQIIGFGGAIHDYSTVVFPQDVRNCGSCHPDSSPEGHVWYSRPTRAACGSCHDDVNWETGLNHTAGPQLGDQNCADCHVPQGDLEFDASVIGAHTIPLKSAQLSGLNVDFLDIIGTGPGEQPMVTFKIYNDDGTSVSPGSLNSFNFLVGGPNREYQTYFRENGLGADFDGQTATYQFQRAIPQDAEGSWTVTADVYRNATVEGRMGEVLSVREAALNPVLDFAVTDAEAMSRRAIVSIQKCNNCHDQLSLHGGQRFKVSECVVCHNPTADDAEVRPMNAGPPESIHFKYMIHKIHSGEELSRDFTVFGFRSSVHNYNEVRYPGDRRNCETCHLPGTYDLPLAEEALPTLAMRDFYSPLGPAAASCLSCHDSRDAAAHAYVNTAPFGEACAACHGEDREFSVARVHAR